MQQPQRSLTVSLKARLVAAGLALFIGVAASELLARVVYPAPPQLGREPQLRFQSDPELGFVHVPNQRGYLDDGLATINDLGLRGAATGVLKPPGSLRVLAVGDSTTFGWGVDDDGTYTAHLERLLHAEWPQRRPHVLNGGVSSYDLRQTLERLERLSPVLEPDIVLVGLLWNDLPFGTIGARVALDPGTPRRTFRMANQPSGIDGLLRRSRLMYALRHAWLKFAPPAEASDLTRLERALLEGRQLDGLEDAWQAVDDLLARLKAMADAGHFRAGVVIMPMRAQVERDDASAAFQERVTAMAAAHALFVVDPLARLRDSREARLFIPYDQMHLSAAGNVVLAEAALDVFRKHEEIIQ
jgi:lysophospholipase L1-like esterase